MELPEFICPETGQFLRRVTGSQVTVVNDACRKKRIVGVAGAAIKGPLSALWMRGDNAVFYVERQKIPILVVGESVVVQEINDREIRASLSKM